MKHLSDEQIQDYLDGNAKNFNGYIGRHLASCQKCQRKLKDYQFIKLALKQNFDFHLPVNFSQLVLKSIKEKKEHSSLFQIGYYIFRDHSKSS